jgi:transposase InsO family protein
MKSINDVTAACETCTRYKRPRPRPVVAMPLASSFNETVAMDLKSWKQCYFLVIVDHATRYCVATFISNKLSETIITALFVCWITIFGAPCRFLSDNGGEFNNDNMRSLGDRFGIRIMCTAAESPWSNGICECLNSVLSSSVQRIIHDTKCSTEIALAWAVSARNALQNCHEFSPNQLVFWLQSYLP